MQQGNQRPLKPGGGKGPPAPPLPPAHTENSGTSQIGSSSVSRDKTYPRSPAGPPGRKK